MFTFIFPGTDIIVTVIPKVTEKELLDHQPFRKWLATLTYNLSLQSKHWHCFNKSPYKLISITIQSIDRWGANEEVGFIKLDCDIRNEHDIRLSGSVFCRGPSVAMLVILRPIGSKNEKYVVLTIQPRIPAGALWFVELPAGMVDGDTFSGAAAREIQEELDFVIGESELINLSKLAISAMPKLEGEEQLPQSMFPSPGGSEEYMDIFLHEKWVTRKTLKDWEGKVTGLKAEGERITLKLIPLERLVIEGAMDGKALAACALYEWHVARALKEKKSWKALTPRRWWFGGNVKRHRGPRR